MGAQDNFQNLINQETDFFANVCDMMLHTKVEAGRSFLCAMNNIVDYFCATTQEESINYQVIYVPTCPEWARELLVRFLIHKVAFTNTAKFLSLAKRKTTGPIILPEGLSYKSRKGKLIEAERLYFKKFLKVFSETAVNNTECKSLFVVQDKDIITRKQDKNPWLEQLFTTNIICDDDNAIVTSDMSAFDIEDVLRKNRENIPNIENVFVFHSQNRGKITFSYNIDQLERLNQYGVGIKNCFVFYISDQPFRLYYSKENIKGTIVPNLIKREIKRFDDFDGFITFLPEELDQMFQRKHQRGRFRIIDSEERDYFTASIDSFFDELPHNYRIKNSLSLAFTPENQKVFLKECETETGMSLPQDTRSFLNFYAQLWENEIKSRITNQLNNYHSVAFVLPPGINRVYKDSIRKMFSAESRKILVVDFNQLRDGVSADLVVLFSFRYTDAKYRTYPNSFDPLPLKEGQYGLTIINRLTHNNYYEWNRYYYDKDLNGLLFSSFRREYIGWSKRSIKKPTIPNIISNLDEAEADAREYMAERCSVVFDKNNSIKRLMSERVLCDNGDQLYISSLKDLIVDRSQFQNAVIESQDMKAIIMNDIKIQFLDDLVSQIKDNLIKRTEADLKAESFIRRDPQFGLTDEQIVSNVELWKYLLKRKVDVLGLEKTYDAIFPNNKDTLVSTKNLDE